MTEHKLSEQEIKPFPFYGYAPGNYMNTCACCKKEMYRVDKLCFVCLECAIKANYATLTRERERVKGLVEVLEWTLKIIQPYTPHQIREIKMRMKETLNNYKNNK